MNIEDLKGKQLDDETFTKLTQYVQGLIGQRDEARQESINGRRTIKTRLEAAEGGITKLLEKLGVESIEEADALPDSKGQAEAAKQLEARIKRMERDLSNAARERDEAVGKYRGSMLKAVVADAIGAHDFVARDLVESYIGSRVTLEGDEVLFKAEDGKLISVRDGVSGFAKARPELLKATGTGGAGVRPSNAGSGNGAQKTMTRAEFDALPPVQKVELSKQGVQLT